MATAHVKLLRSALRIGAAVAIVLLLVGVLLGALAYVTRSRPEPQRDKNYREGQSIAQGLAFECQLYYRDVGAFPPNTAELIRHGNVYFLRPQVNGVYVPEDAVFEFHEGKRRNKSVLFGIICLPSRDPSYPAIEYDMESEMFIEPITGEKNLVLNRLD